MVKLRSDQERVKALLKETITLLCKNGLDYKNQFCVEALIGITLDDSNVFLVRFEETVGPKGVGNGTAVQLPPAPAPVMAYPSLALQHPIIDMQSFKNSHLSLYAQSLEAMPSQTHNLAQAKCSTPKSTPPPSHVQKHSQPVTLSLHNDRKRRASSSPVRLVVDTAAGSPDIPEQVTTPGANSNEASDLSNHSVPTNETHSTPTPLSIQPESADPKEPEQEDDEDDDDEQPQNLVKVKEEPRVSEAEAMEESQHGAAAPLQTAPLNLTGQGCEEPTDAGCSTWDPANIQQKAAQAAAAAITKADSPATSMANSPAPAQASEQDAPSPWSLLKSALNTPQQNSSNITPIKRSTDSPTLTGSPSAAGETTPKSGIDEEGMGYYYAVSNPSYSLEKRYVCDFAGCNYTSSRKYNLMRHGRTHHEDQRIPCPECPGTFVDKYILKEHMASAHAKFTVPIEGTNMIGVGISSTIGMKMETTTSTVTSSPLIGPLPPGVQRPLIPSTSTHFSNKRKRSTPNHNPRRTSAGGKLTPNTASPMSKAKKNMSGGWHIPRLAPAATATSASSSSSPISSSSVEQMLNLMKAEGTVGTVDQAMLNFMKVERAVNVAASASEAEQNNNNVIKDSLASSMQVVFPGMVDAAAAAALDLDNNNSSKLPSANNNNNNEDEDSLAKSASSPTTSSSGGTADLSANHMQVVFPGMEMVPSPESAETSPEKDRSVLETSDGEDGKVSE